MSKLNIILSIVSAVLLIGCLGFYTKNKDLKEQLTIAQNNSQAWLNAANDRVEANRILQLTIDEFKETNDSLVHQLNYQKEELAIKDKQLRQAVAIETVVRDTTVVTVPIETDFNVELKPNSLTTINIARKDSVITHTMEILNHQDLFVTEKKQYRKQYKNWFIRLLHFDFRKEKINSYQIVNSNDLINILDTRVINITD